ncbi:MAG: SDR family NAD(P)-dependent oxidoreductase [Candidatus Odinarchaeia archaeon]
MRLKNKVAVITGSASGIGEASAKLFSREGAKIVVADLQVEKGKKVVEEINNSGGEAIFVKTNVADFNSVKNLVDTAVNKYGKINIMYNNAGIAGPIGVAHEIDLDDWHRTLSINVSGVFYGSRAVIPQMIKQGGGVIINTASNWGFVAQPGWSVYHASKGAVVMLTKAMAIDYAKYNIRINAVCPGYVETPLLLKAVAESEDPEKEMEEMGRLAKPEEIAYAALFLASDESSFAVGTCLIIDNGETARGGSVKDHLPPRK